MMVFDLAIPNHRVLSSLLLALFTWYPCCSNILPLSGKFILCVPQIPASLLTVQPLSLSTKHISSWHSLSPLSFCKRLALGYSPGSNSPGLSTRDDLTQTAAPAASRGLTGLLPLLREESTLSLRLSSGQVYRASNDNTLHFSVSHPVPGRLMEIAC